jgi:hypothetical protein
MHRFQAAAKGYGCRTVHFVRMRTGHELSQWALKFNQVIPPITIEGANSKSPSIPRTLHPTNRERLDFLLRQPVTAWQR